MTNTITAWLATLPPSGFRGTATTLHADLARCLAPGESLPSLRTVARTVGAMLAETRYTLCHDRKTAARWIVIEAVTVPTSANLPTCGSAELPGAAA